MGSINGFYQSLAQRVIPVLAVVLVAIAIVSPSGSQPAAALIVLFSLPLLFMRSQPRPGVSRLWLVMLIWPILASIPLFIASGTGEALAGSARYFLAAMVLLAIGALDLNPKAILRAASAGGIVAVVLNIGSLDEMRVNWGVGYLDSGYISVLLLSLSLGQFHADKGRVFWRVFALFGIACLVFAAMKTGTRGAWPAMVVVFLLQFFLLDFSRKKKMLFAAAGIMTFTLSLFTIPSVNERIDLTVYEVQSYYKDGNRASSMGYRLDFWHIALRCFSESPLWGVSYQRRSELMQAYTKEQPVSASIGQDGRSSSHNEILNSMAKRGLLGAIAILLLYLVPLRFFISGVTRNHSELSRTISLAGIGMVLTMILCGITEAPLMNVRVGTTYAFLLVFLYQLLTSMGNIRIRRKTMPT